MLDVLRSHFNSNILFLKFLPSMPFYWAGLKGVSDSDEELPYLGFLPKKVDRNVHA